MLKKYKNTTWIFTLSGLFEYYDFIIYGLMSGYLGPLFFPNQDPLVSQLQAFSLFALGYLIRPLGGLFFAIWGDLSNRRNIFIKSNFVIAFSTLAIAFLPNYNQIGIIATIILIILRILQAASFAIELPGVISLIRQNDGDDSTKRFGFVLSATSLGAIMATSSLYLLEANFSKEEILEYAWRIPFIFGSVLCLISALMRLRLPQNTQVQQNREKILGDILLEYKNICAFVLIILLPAFLIVMNIFFPQFIPKYYDYSSQEVYFATTISLIWAVLYAPIFSYLSSSWPKDGIIKFTIGLTIFLGLIINFLLLRQSLTHLLIGLCLYQSIITTMMVTVFPLMAEMFPERIRLTLVTICYNLTYSLVAFSPVFVTRLAESWNSPFALWFIVIILCIFILANIANFSVVKK